MPTLYLLKATSDSLMGDGDFFLAIEKVEMDRRGRPRAGGVGRVHQGRLRFTTPEAAAESLEQFVEELPRKLKKISGWRQPGRQLPEMDGGFTILECLTK